MNSGINYTVNEKKRTVVAYIPDGYTNVKRQVRRKIGKINQELGYAFYEVKAFDQLFEDKNMCMPAFCDPSDEWDEEKGKSIARSRLLVHESNVRLRMYVVAYEQIEKWLDAVGELYQKEYIRNLVLTAERDIHLGYLTEDFV